MLPCLLSAQLFNVQVKVSWWLAVWSQEVASARGACEEWSVVVVERARKWAREGKGANDIKKTQHHVEVIKTHTHTHINTPLRCRIPCSYVTDRLKENNSTPFQQAVNQLRLFVFFPSQHFPWFARVCVCEAKCLGLSVVHVQFAILEWLLQALITGQR